VAGEVASLFLSRMTVPILFYLSERKNHEELVLDNRLPFETESDVPDVSTCGESTGNQAANLMTPRH
jgi:hypothetical protein